jgi:hypothetical protein
MKSASWARLLIATLCSATAAVPARAEREVAVDVSVSGGLATNPYLVNGSTKTRPSVSVEVAPRIVTGDEITTFQLIGRGRITEYFGDYRTNSSLGVNAGVEHRASPALTLRANAGYETSIVGLNDALFAQVDPNTPGVTYPDVIDDVALTGQGERRHAFHAGTGADYRLSERDSLSLGASATAVRFSGGSSLDEYNSYNGSIGYNRRLTPQLQIGAQFGLGRVNYLKQSVGDATILSPGLAVTYQLSPTWRLQGTGGVSISRINDLAGRSTSTNPSGSISLCNTGLNASYCLAASQQSLPSARDGVRSQTTLSASMERRLSELGRVSVALGYSRASAPLARAASGQRVEYASATGTYSHQINRRAAAFVSAGYSDSFQTGVSRRANIQVGAGIRVTLGTMR